MADYNTDQNLSDQSESNSLNQQESSSSDLEGQTTNNPVSQSSDNEQNKDGENGGEPNLDAAMVDKNRNMATSFHDNTRRTTTRANEATDRLDSGSGGLTSGGVKSATDY